MLKYDFMVRALIVGILLGMMIPIMGVIVVNRKTATIGDALSHASLAGIGLGLLLSLSPLVGAIIGTVIGVLSIEGIRKRIRGHGDLATAIVMSSGVGFAALLSDLVPGTMRLESFLFGSIITISQSEVWIAFLLGVFVIGTFCYYYYELLYMSTDIVEACVAGVNIGRVSFIMNILLAFTIAIGARVVGVMMVSSLMVLPVACAYLVSGSYRKTVIVSMILGTAFVLIGLVFSYYFGIKPGGAIVLTGVFTLAMILIIQKLFGSRG